MLSVMLVGTGSGRVTSGQSAQIDCGSMCSASLDAGSSVTLTAMPAASSYFIGWSGNCSGVGACTLTMDAAKMVSARFSLSQVVFHSARKVDGSDAVNANTTANIWVVKGDGTALTALTTATANGAGSGFPQWSPDASKIVFRSSRKLDGTDAPNPNTTLNLWRINANGSGLMPLTTATAMNASSGEPVWSPDGMSIVFDSRRKIDGSDAAGPNLTSNIWRVNADGSNLRIVTNLTAASADSFEPQWSPDGTKIVFSSRRKLDGSDAASPNLIFNIWRINADGTGAMPLTTTTAAGTTSGYPQWSPDGTKVLFYSSRALDGTDARNLNGTDNIWQVNADGTGVRLVTNTTAMNAHNFGGVWSPDGTTIAFESIRKLDGSDAANANNTFNIWRVNPDGSGLTPLTHATANGAHSSDPRWSADGTKIVFDSSLKLDGTDAPNLNMTGNIWRVNADSTGLMPLTTTTALSANSEWPSFGP